MRKTWVTLVFLPIGKPFPALGAGGVMVGVVASGFSRTSVTMNLVGRAFTATLDQPSSWGSNLITDKTFSGNDDYNTGDLTSLSLGTAAFAQLGLVITSTTGWPRRATDVRGSLRAGRLR